MYFYGFRQTVWLLTGTPLNFILFSHCFLEEFHLVLLLATIWRPFVYHLRITFFWSKIRKLDTLPYIFMLYISQKFCCLEKLQKIYCFHKNVLYLQDIVLTCNIWKHLCWTHFYNLVASFRRVQQQKNFVMLSRFWSL